MRALNASTLAHLDAGTIIMRQMIRFEFGTGFYGFWTGSHRWSFDGVDYLPGGILQIDGIEGTYGLSADGITLTLAAAPDDGLTPDVLATIEQEDYHQRVVRIMDLYIDPDTLEVALIEPVYRGLVDTIEHRGGAEPALIAQCESRSLDNSREGYRTRSLADQRLIDPDDRGLEHAETAREQEIFWGRERSR